MTEGLSIGAELGDYRVLRALAGGGMGVVYEAEDLPLRRKVALKVLRPNLLDDAKARTRFQREIDHAVAIEHPHVVPIYSAGFEPPHFYIAMRLIPGPDLAKVLRDAGTLPEARSLRLLGQIASALHAMHERGLVHRDIKPHNVLVWGEGAEDEEHALLTDFGIAKALDDTGTITGVTPIGTPAYMPPEVWVGQRATPASDQYSLGCVAFELLTGRLPFDEDALSFREAHVENAPMALAAVAPHISPPVAEAVDRALAKDPARRHPSVRELVRSAEGSDKAFRESRAISRVVSAAEQPAEVVARLTTEHGLTDLAISQITGLDRLEVVKLRRRQARRALVGRRSRRPAGPG